MAALPRVEQAEVKAQAEVKELSEEYNFTSNVSKETMWVTHRTCVVSLVCRPTNSVKDRGHATIVVEALRNNKKFFGQYDLLAELWPRDTLLASIPGVSKMTERGVIKQIRVYEKNEPVPEHYKDYHSRSWSAVAAEVYDMILAIKKDEKEVTEARLKVTEWDQFPARYRYQTLGAKRFPYLESWYGPHNCASWAAEMLLKAHISSYHLSDSSFFDPPTHAGQGCVIL